MSELRKRNIPAALICSDPFVSPAKRQLSVFGMPDLPLVVIPHPLGGLSLADVQGRAEIAIGHVIGLIKEQLQ